MLRDMEPDERRRNVKAIIGELPEEERRLSPEDHILLENLKLLRETTFKNADFSAYKK